MPELPEVEGVVRLIKPAVEGRTITDVFISDTVRRSKAGGKDAILKRISEEGFIEELTGASFLSVERRSKYIYFDMQKEGRFLFVNHLGMTGAWFHVGSLEEIREEKFRRHVHVIFTLDDGSLFVYSDIRRFGEMRVLQDESGYPPLLLMAPEPFGEDALQHFLEMSERPKYAKKPVKEVIMDGQVISGCGNIYATEALFKERVRPDRPVGGLTSEEKVKLFQTIADILAESIEAGGSTISDYRNVNGESGSMQHRLKMYGKKHCLECGHETENMKIGGRTSTFCPVCQK
ncbi:bifunctional DNA-formamidopyrimidine glycosylase/DNA-(apurinic or apyrimidinic site) lyase [Planococcus lenghuensis]|uniref:Formamidopyrimidine-DNA glycosylase n=1 Tax=Planococcus lenghuensis TaxID=2213202 RepID=A0A1Q2KXF1_9BACL|nr:bifunctional DNA-formamidopyrimidine glycosylase/DNA-(apurinic or apyrimidinic site) lyase [Planococcus lenghuensis]AQQ52823.1 DNA-formamidopyrimidine glycosylase [Planococcus lenghuensis]